MQMMTWPVCRVGMLDSIVLECLKMWLKLQDARKQTHSMRHQKKTVMKKSLKKPPKRSVGKRSPRMRTTKRTTRTKGSSLRSTGTFHHRCECQGRTRQEQPSWGGTPARGLPVRPAIPDSGTTSHQLQASTARRPPVAPLPRQLQQEHPEEEQREIPRGGNPPPAAAVAAVAAAVGVPQPPDSGKPPSAHWLLCPNGEHPYRPPCSKHCTVARQV
mmetsp:Transcript_52184/g.113661  ORF Transcript_52184/g.113661 Transcript_52184/m.113661 type:complete len:215 (-) Transcript_52184:322-966(-)